MNIELYDDQINSNRWAELCDFIYSDLPDNHDCWETELLHTNPHIKKVNAANMPKRGTVFINGHNSIKKCLDALSPDGSYILVSRDRDFSISHDIIRKIPGSLRKFYTINTPFKNAIIEPIPVGCATRGGFSGSLPMICKENYIENKSNNIYCRITLTNSEAGKERRELISSNKNNPIFKIDYELINAEDMYRNIKKHVFNACPAGEGKDCIRTYETIILGSIPIWSDCAETRHFSNLPVIYTKNWNFTRELLDQMLDEYHNKKHTTDNIRMSYWIDHFRESKKLI